MNKKIVFGIITILFLSFLSCESDTIEGKWDDNIKLSQKEINFTAESNSIVITTEGTWWWINGIGLDDDWSFDTTSIDTSEDNFLIEENEFTIERRNADEIHINMTQNQLDVKRILIINLQAGNYFDGIKIIQSGN